MGRMKFENLVNKLDDLDCIENISSGAGFSTNVWRDITIRNCAINICTNKVYHVNGLLTSVEGEVRADVAFDENANLICLHVINEYEIKDVEQSIKILDKHVNIHPDIKNYFNLPVNKSEVYL